MKLLDVLCMVIFWIEYSHCISRRESDGYIVKFSREYYSKNGIKDRDTIIRDMKADKTKGIAKRIHDFGDMSLYYDDFITKERVIMFYISQEDCNILVNDTIRYEQHEHANIVEHMILHNNAEYIDPKGVFSSDIEINYFVFNKKINLYSVFFNNPKKVKEYHVEYDYNAIGGIKEVKDFNTGKVNNTFLWKLYNENTNQPNQRLRIEIYFDLGKVFHNEEVYFNELEFRKNIKVIDGAEVVVYIWEGEMKSQEVMVIQASFPGYIENCGVDYVTLPMVLLGSVFIVFLVIILYLIISSMIFDGDV
jgi:hypothetical protein